jgi:hypothetical protein
MVLQGFTGAVQLAWMMDDQTHSQGRFSGRRFGNTVSSGHQIDSQGDVDRRRSPGPSACRREAREAGIEHFIFVTGRNKAVIADHFDMAVSPQ